MYHRDVNTKKGFILSSPPMEAKFMHRCFELARHGSGRVSPNPLVGCVIVENGEIIGEGFHQKFGGPHAEVNAIQSVKDAERLKRATLYVNLEPCSHFGKTPPCADLIVSHQIPKVVIANRDPFAEVNGKGMDILQKSGIEVIAGYEKDAGAWLNRRFFTFHEKKRPYIILKAAQSANGYMDRERNEEDTGINWISSPETQYLTHSWRSKEDAILIGTRTALTDNPSLTARRIRGQNPHRLLIDRNLVVGEDAEIYNNNANTTVFNAVKDSSNGNITLVKLDFDRDVLPQILEYAWVEQLQSIIIEGGDFTIDQFIMSQLWDEARIITGQAVFDGGLRTPEIPGNPVESYVSGLDQINVITRRI